MRLVTSSLVISSLALRAAAGVVPLGAQPAYSYDPNTTKYCSWWWDNDGTTTCDARLDALGIPREDFFRWVSDPLYRCALSEHRLKHSDTEPGS